MIEKEWNLYFSRDGGWWGSAEKATMTATVRITTGPDKYQTFQDCYNVLEVKIKMHESEKTQ